MRTIPLNLPGRGYDIVVGSGVRSQVREAARRCRADRIVVVSDTRVSRFHAADLIGRLQDGGIPVTLLTIRPGERSKTPRTAIRLWEQLAEAGATRHTLVVACGGGVVGDLAGFVAATFARGLPYVQMPTTVLAMVDSAIGGKTGVNLPSGKNLVGAFHQPEAVLCDLEYLRTLSADDFVTGWAEIIKCAIIADASLFETLVAHHTRLLRHEDESLLEAVIARCAQIKADVVAADERDTGKRAILNYGHTVGHALEAALRYRGLPHGRAVAWGMVVAGQLSVRLHECAPAAGAAQNQALQAFGLLAPPPALPPWDALARAMERDKKRAEGGLRWVLLQEVGRVVPGRVVPQTLVREVTEEVFAGAGAGAPRA